MTAKEIIKEYVKTTRTKYLNAPMIASGAQSLGDYKYGKFYSQGNYERRFRELKNEGKLDLKEVKKDLRGNAFRFVTWVRA